jgi:arginine N-succinyltransferase
LVVDPAYRRMPERLGRFVSYGRYAFIFAQRSHFRDQLLAELLPPLEADGTSHLWEALGRRFTGLTYAEADRLSSLDKEFVRDLFPLGIVNTSLMDPRARAVLGQVGQQTLGVERMLERIGFRYARRIDPFDGGPHFVARTDDVTLVRRSRRVRYAGPLAGPVGPGGPGLLLRVLPAAPFALAVQAVYLHSADGELSLSPEVAAHLRLDVGDELVLTPLSTPSEEGAGGR